MQSVFYFLLTHAIVYLCVFVMNVQTRVHVCASHECSTLYLCVFVCMHVHMCACINVQTCFCVYLCAYVHRKRFW